MLIYLVSIVVRRVIPKVIGEVVKRAFGKPFTIHYPFEPIEAFDGYRGRIRWNVKKCIGCGMCEKVCPAEAIEMVPDERFKTKRGPRFIHYRCIFCGLCADHCPTKAIELTKDYHTFGLKKEDVKIEIVEE